MNLNREAREVRVSASPAVDGQPERAKLLLPIGYRLLAAARRGARS